MTDSVLVFDTLKELGYYPEFDQDGDITIRYQMKYLYFVMGTEEDNYVSILLPSIYKIQPTELFSALFACNSLAEKYMVMKCHVEKETMSVLARYEFFFTDKNSLTQNINKALEMLGMVRFYFKMEMQKTYKSK